MKNVLTTTFQNFQMWVSENFSFNFLLELREFRSVHNKNKRNQNNTVKMHVSMLGGPSTKLYNCRRVRSTSDGSSTASDKKNRDKFRETDQKAVGEFVDLKSEKEKNPNDHFCFPIYFACFEL